MKITRLCLDMYVGYKLFENAALIGWQPIKYFITNNECTIEQKIGEWGYLSLVSITVGADIFTSASIGIAAGLLADSIYKKYVMKET